MSDADLHAEKSKLMCLSPRIEVLGNHRRQSQQSRLELGLCFSDDSNGRTVWIADAHRDDGKRFVVRAAEKLTTFMELERVSRNDSD